MKSFIVFEFLFFLSLLGQNQIRTAKESKIVAFDLTSDYFLRTNFHNFDFPRILANDDMNFTTNSSESQNVTIISNTNTTSNSILSKKKKKKKDLSFTHGFLESLALIFVSEFGDKTFMLIAFHTMKYERISVIIPAFITMVCLHLMSVGIGSIFPLLLDRRYIMFIAVGLFFGFGCKMLHEACKMKKEEYNNLPDLEVLATPKSKPREVSIINTEGKNEVVVLPSSEREFRPTEIELMPKNTETAENNEVKITPDTTPSANECAQEAFRSLPIEVEMMEEIKDDQKNQFEKKILEDPIKSDDIEMPTSPSISNKIKKIENKDKPKCPFFKLISLLFLADWGDNCQIAAIALTATRNIWGVALGGAIGMGLCVVLSVTLGIILEGKISSKTTTYIGAILLFFFTGECIYFIISDYS